MPPANSTRLAGMRVLIYARYSSSLQSEASIEDQVRRCSEYVLQHGGVVSPEDIFPDYAMSGASMVRPAFERMMQIVETQPKLLAIVTEDVSRVSRDFADSAILYRRLQYLDVPLIGVGDGIDTGEKNGKVTYGLKSLIGEIYLDDLRDKTLRGLEGRCLAGYSTGGLPFGYCTVPDVGHGGRALGNLIRVDDAHAAVVRRVFALYLEGRSLAGIARTFNAEGLPSPRAHTRYPRKGWVPSTIREFLHNVAYVGLWSYKKRQWRKLPGTNTRRPRAREEREILRQEYPERRIIAEDVWEAVSARLKRVRAHYVHEGREPNAEASVPGRRTSYVLSGILCCGACGAPMFIAGGSSARYYACSDARKRGTCGNRLSVREDLARRCVFAELRKRLLEPAALAYVRERIAARLSDFARERDGLRRSAGEAQRITEGRTRNIVDAMADGERSDSLRQRLRELEADAGRQRAVLAQTQGEASGELTLPDPEVIVQRALDLEAMVARDPTAARERIRGYFENGRLRLQPQPDGFYIAEGRLLPLMFFTGDGAVRPRAPAISCAGGI